MTLTSRLPRRPTGAPTMGGIINFCSEDERFIRPSVEQARRCCAEIVVAVGDTRFDGSPEDDERIRTIAADMPDIEFVRYEVDLSRSAHDLHNQARIAGFGALASDPDLVVFLDADEILDGAAVAEWLRTSRIPRTSAAMKLKNYWYFRDPTNQALTTEDSVVVVWRHLISPELLDGPDERDSIFRGVVGRKRRRVTGRGGRVLVHHYSWVRTKEQMLKKVASWGHRDERDWSALVKAEFAGPFKGTDFVHGYEYRQVEPFVDI